MILLSLGLYAFFLLLFFFFSSRGENRIPFLLVLQLLPFQEARGLPNLEQIPRDRVVCSEVVAISGCDAAANFRPRCPVSGPVVHSASCAPGRLTIGDMKWGLGPLAGSGAFYSPLNWVQLPSQWRLMAGLSLWGGKGEGSIQPEPPE